jgi:Dolichyl-phosphate-mannose-protein mannosyltransferase
VTSYVATPTSVEATKARPALSAWVLGVAAVQLLVLLLTSTRYGYHRDEMYFIVAGAHPAVGYPDQPPIVPLVCWFMNELAAGSLLVLRLPSALASAATSVIAALVARELGGGRRAQVFAAACAASSGFALAVGHFVTTTTFDLLSTSAFGWLMIRAILRRSGVELLVAGVVVGIGCEAKPQVGLVAVVVLLSLALVGPRWPLRSGWLAAGVAAAAVLAAPYVIWQARHGWPQLTVAGNIAGSAEGGRAGFLPFQLVMVSPLLAPVWIIGLVAPLWRSAWRPTRFLSVAYVILAVVYLVGNGKAYYLASMYPVLLGLGAVVLADWTVRSRRPRVATGLITGGIAVSAGVSALIALPLLPASSLQGSFIMAVNPDQGETVGWPRFIDTVSAAWHFIPAVERSHAVIVTENYGEAAAIDVLGRQRDLPSAFSGHNGFSEWGRPPPAATWALVVGYSLDTLTARHLFQGCRLLARVDNGLGLDNDEQHRPLLLCQPASPWASLWSRLRHYD